MRGTCKRCGSEYVYLRESNGGSEVVCLNCEYVDFDLAPVVAATDTKTRHFTKPWPRRIFILWCEAHGDFRSASGDYQEFEGWSPLRCWLMRMWARMRILVLSPLWTWLEDKSQEAIS